MRTEAGLHFERGGTGEPTLLLLHGLGGVGEVWRGVEELLTERWPGSWIIPDLPGHGRSAASGRYSFGGMTAAIAETITGTGPVVVLGHSLGGVLGLTLATGWFGVPVAAVCGLGIKVQWSAAELTKAAEVAAKPARAFETRDEAAQRWLRVAGLEELWAVDAPGLGSAVTRAGDGWRTTVDQRAFGVGEPDVAGLLAVSNAEVLLAAGAGDTMCPAEDLLAVQGDAVVLPGLGHNAHVEDPKAVWSLVERLHSGIPS
jgi:pimeloyl-ACP methyl ester carboxylesterase